jgi:PTH1 family peptidyl-tRNA hydrolase
MPKNQTKWLIFALGNPGGEYENTYHNAGVMALPVFADALAGVKMEELDWKTHKKLFEYAEPPLTPPWKGGGAQSLVFARSFTFMNESGRAAAEAVKKFGVSPDHLVVLQDDSDITLGEFKLSFDRSSGGHKGAQSVIDYLKTQTFWRARFGVRPSSAKATEGKPARRLKAGDFVLAKLTPTATKKLGDAFRKAAEELSRAISGKLRQR